MKRLRRRTDTASCSDEPESKKSANCTTTFTRCFSAKPCVEPVHDTVRLVRERQSWWGGLLSAFSNAARHLSLSRSSIVQLQRRCVWSRTVGNSWTVLHRLGPTTSADFRSSTPESVSCLDVDPEHDGYLLCGTRTGSIRVHNLFALDAGKTNVIPMPRRFQHKNQVAQCQWFAGGIRMFLSTGNDKQIKLWDVGELTALDSIPLQRLPVAMHWDRAKVSPLVALADLSTHVSLIDFRIGDFATDVRVGMRATAVHWLQKSEERLLAVGANDGRVSIFDIRSPKRVLREVQRLHSGSIGALLEGPSGGRLISVGRDSRLGQWSTANFEPISAARLHCALAQVSSEQPGFRCALLDDGARPLVALPSAADVALVDVESGALKATLRAHCSTVKAVAYRKTMQQMFSCAIGEPTVAQWAPTPDCQTTESRKDDKRVIATRDAWSDDEEEDND